MEKLVLSIALIVYVIVVSFLSGWLIFRICQVVSNLI